MSNTTTDILSKVKLWSAIPEGQPAFSDTELLDILTDELRTTIAPFIVQFREDFFVDYIDYSITSSITSFEIPTRSISTVLKDVKYIDGSTVRNVPRVPVGDAEYYTNGFYLRGNKIILINPENRSGQTLRVYYYSRPSKLVTVASCSKVVSFTAPDIVVDGVPATWGATEILDITQANSPLGLISKDNTTTIVSTTFTPTSIPDELQVGDYISKANESCIPQIPLEVIPMLIQSAVMRVHEILSDKRSLEIATDKYERLKKSVTDILSPRVVEEAKTIVSNGSFLSSSYNRLI